MSDDLVLVADTGGTNTRMALARGRALVEDSTERFRNAEYSGLTEVIGIYLARHGVAPTRAAFAAAGLIEGRRIELTNHGWYIDAAEIEAATGISSVHLLNDLQAQGHALAGLSADKLRPLRAGQPKGDTKLVIGLGTGVNAALVYPGPHGRVVPPAEAGHMHLPLHGADDYRLADWLIARRGIASVEDVLAGSGLERLYAFHAEQAGTHGGLEAGAIMQAMADGHPLAQAVGRHYVRLLAQTTASLALVTLPYAGIYFIGGVSRAFAPWFEPFSFDAAFTDMGRMTEVMKTFPIALVEDDYAALLGCAGYLQEV
ncbi:MAG: glucokinase [Roseinatronobacter sp.]